MDLKSTLHRGHLLLTFDQLSIQAKQNLCRQSGSMPHRPVPRVTESEGFTVANTALALCRLRGVTQTVASFLRTAGLHASRSVAAVASRSDEIIEAEVHVFDRLADQHSVVIVDNLVDASEVPLYVVCICLLLVWLFACVYLSFFGCFFSFDCPYVSGSLKAGVAASRQLDVFIISDESITEDVCTLCSIHVLPLFSFVSIKTKRLRGTLE